MKKLLPFFFLIVIISCSTEEDAGPANKNTFLRYFGSEYSHTALSALETADGYTMLSNIDIPTDGFGNFMNKARVIHTDKFGNLLWQREYPSWAEDTLDVPGKFGGFKASSFIAKDDGYLLVGERIYSKDKSDLKLLEIDFNGVITDSLVVSGSKIDDNPDDNFIPSLHGRAVVMVNQQNPSVPVGNYIVLASVSGLAYKDMMVAEVNTSLDAPTWQRPCGDGITTLVSRVFFNSNAEILWGGTYQQDLQTQSDLRLVLSRPDITPENGVAFGLTALKETASDICETIGGFAFIGTSQVGSSDKDMMLTIVSKAGLLINTRQINFDNDAEGNKRPNSSDDIGNAISKTSDGGLIALGTVKTTDNVGNGGSDFYLMKLTANGETDGTLSGINIGGPNNEEGACVLETADKSYLIYGNTTFGSLKKLVLMKVDSKGRL